MTHASTTPASIHRPIGRARLLGTLAMGCLSMACLLGCAERRLRITSEPSGALVTINDQEVGVTPLDAGLTYYGEYDVRLEHPGYEVLRERRRAEAPIYEYPPLDLAAEAAPWGVRTTIAWHFVLTPALESTQDQATFEAQLLERARGLRSEIATPASSPTPTPTPTPAPAP